MSNLIITRIIAMILGIGATFFGVILLCAFGIRAFIPPFGVGYLLAIGYLIIAIAPPVLIIRQIIWGASVLIQGAWLCLAFVDAAVGGPSIGAHGPSPAFFWWAFATMASIAALNLDRRFSTNEEVDEASIK